LLITQVVDVEDPVLGFLHRWLEEFSKHVEHIEVICLKEGKHRLPPNVKVHSLGKENISGFRKFKYGFRFLSLISRLRKNYDMVLVHMNPEYVILGGLFWKLTGVRVNLWYNHPHKGLRLAIAAHFSDKIFFTSPYAASAHFPQAERMPAGIDVNVFKPQTGVEKNRYLIYSQGRIMPSKRIDVLLQAFRMLRAKVPATLMLVGPEDKSYGRELRTRFADLIESGAVVFKGPVPNHETPFLYSAAGVSVNLAASGHFDKSVLEAMACGTPVVISSKAFDDLVPLEWVIPENDPQALADALELMMTLPEREFEALSFREKEAVARTHSLPALTAALVGTFS
jgi:glycosyltransferase involved in cell wall biosynthesis